MEQKIHKPLWFVSGRPYLGRMPSHPINLLILGCSKPRVPCGRPVNRYLGNVNVGEELQLIGKNRCMLNPLLKNSIALERL